ncbi:ATP-binding protein [Stutzerimonas kirkiae]|uniref:histidine kinase n=1 Tax=Stutzerimonas kirkiae TaxID=2211392 RepID=A0A4Q9RAX2_9GAMM|nr:ATP-binding protein [Stutzerimonas kirkiae]TBU97340.1 sensor histidine kinase [Stutzerimonas kirkiae]TBV02972.1 sensor histidine kinase [Stutzerimonas kirkiae]TBV06631.1 sensor histidine kinase [Stutzerimonas kirkiae]TBV13073.1 sensor histidine kinase [Stutzerimonas kirkiae]
MHASVHSFSASRQNLRLLTLIRCLVLAAQAGAVGLAYVTELLTLPWLALGITLSVSALLCLGTAIRLYGPWPVTDLEYAAHLACDLLIHSALLYYSGGSTNPFVSYYLVPLTIAAATLPWLYSIVLSGLALLGYTLMLVWYDPVNVPPLDRSTLLVYGMWLSFALAAALITFFVTRMAEELRRQEQLQSQRREESLRDQQLLAVATQAAGAAHELGTPLATMSVLLKELRQEYKDPGLQEDLGLLQSQVQLCKDSLQQLVRAAEADRRQAIQEQTAREWVETVLQRWHLMRPEATYRFQCVGVGSPPHLMPPADLSQSLLNLLNNATDACPDDLEIRLDWNEQWLKLSIRDHGAGVPLAIAEQIGRPFITTKGGRGFGLGLFLSQASVTRAGGTVKLYNHEDGGTLTELRLPHGSVRV